MPIFGCFTRWNEKKIFDRQSSFAFHAPYRKSETKALKNFEKIYKIFYMFVKINQVILCFLQKLHIYVKFTNFIN